MAAALPPAKPTTTLDFGRCFTFVTEDPDWVKKVLIGAAFTFASIFIVGLFFVAGYCAQVIKRVAAGDPRPLPEWDDLGGIFSEGLRLGGLYLAYSVGFLFLGALAACPIALALWGVSGAGAGQRGVEGAAAVLGVFGMLSIYAVVLLMSLTLNAILPAAATRVIFKDQLGAGFEFAQVVGFIRQNLGNYLLTLLAALVANFAAQFGVVLCCVGVLPAVFWAYLTLAHGLGQTVRANPASVG